MFHISTHRSLFFRPRDAHSKLTLHTFIRRARKSRSTWPCLHVHPNLIARSPRFSPSLPLITRRSKFEYARFFRDGLVFSISMSRDVCACAFEQEFASVLSDSRSKVKNVFFVIIPPQGQSHYSKLIHVDLVEHLKALVAWFLLQIYCRRIDVAS